MKIGVKTDAKSLASSGRTMTVADIIPSDIKVGTENQFLTLDNLDNLGFIEFDGAVIKTPLSEAIAYKFRLGQMKDINNHQIARERRNLEEALDKLLKTPALQAFVVTGYYKASDDIIEIGYNGSKLALVQPVSRIDQKSMTFFYDPLRLTEFNSSIPKPLRLDDTKFPIFVFKRQVDSDVDEEVLSYLNTDPISLLHLAAYVEEMAMCYTKISTMGVVQSSYNLLSKLRKWINLKDDDQTLVEVVPRSLEELFRLHGYEGNLPLIDASYGYIKMPASDAGSTKVPVSISCLDKIVIDYEVKYGKLSEMGHELEFETRTLFKDKTTTITKVGFEQTRSIFRFLVALYVQENFKKGSRVQLDLHQLYKNIWTKANVK